MENWLIPNKTFKWRYILKDLAWWHVILCHHCLDLSSFPWKCCFCFPSFAVFTLKHIACRPCFPLSIISSQNKYRQQTVLPDWLLQPDGVDSGNGAGALNFSAQELLPWASCLPCWNIQDLVCNTRFIFGIKHSNVIYWCKIELPSREQHRHRKQRSIWWCRLEFLSENNAKQVCLVGNCPSGSQFCFLLNISTLITLSCQVLLWISPSFPGLFKPSRSSLWKCWDRRWNFRARNLLLVILLWNHGTETARDYRQVRLLSTHLVFWMYLVRSGCSCLFFKCNCVVSGP